MIQSFTPQKSASAHLGDAIRKASNSEEIRLALKRVIEEQEESETKVFERFQKLLKAKGEYIELLKKQIRDLEGEKTDPVFSTRRQKWN